MELQSLFREELSLPKLHVECCHDDRQFLWSFRLPGEAQKIDRMMECFAERYCELNPGVFTSTGGAFKSSGVYTSPAGVFMSTICTGISVHSHLSNLISSRLHYDHPRSVRNYFPWEKECDVSPDNTGVSH